MPLVSDAQLRFVCFLQGGKKRLGLGSRKRVGWETGNDDFFPPLTVSFDADVYCAFLWHKHKHDGLLC